jgi:hypothetical protein
MRKMFLALAATAAVVSTGALTTRADAMTLPAGIGLNAAVDTANAVEPTTYYYGYRRHYGYGGYGYGYRRYYGGYRGYYGGYRRYYRW